MGNFFIFKSKKNANETWFIFMYLFVAIIFSNNIIECGNPFSYLFTPFCIDLNEKNCVEYVYDCWFQINQFVDLYHAILQKYATHK